MTEYKTLSFSEIVTKVSQYKEDYLSGSVQESVLHGEVTREKSERKQS
jgi:hypothetical protein